MARADTLCNQSLLEAGERPLERAIGEPGDVKTNFITREGSNSTPSKSVASIKKAADLNKPLEKKVYKGTNPTCHDFNTASINGESVSLLIGFSTGQIQLIDPFKKELSKLFNEERLIDKSKVTCLRWVPGSRSLFLSAHASGQFYVYNEELPCGNTAPHYQPFKAGSGAAINELAFSPNGSQLAVVTQDGLLRVFQYDSMELLGVARSYFGGLLCVAWSGDGRLIAVGGEDDLVTVYSNEQKRVIARAQGHRSWIGAVAFDWYLEGEACYRIGSVGHDTQICLWELPEDDLVPPRPRVKRRSDPLQLVGTPACPRLDECPILEPLVCKKIAHERLTCLIFRPDCFITACQDGYVYTWARPSRPPT
ncbi:hypothetical protein GWI33_019969 [Rhynchophorus ferrugineus]|uniref:WD repeat-containing protein 20 n=1 Tax=Rhynchophorus ferrugineus TaxID=354439 RepID=A0A834M6E6_RHYFE|nr:hypothetical protein GWI33_019969 [Rhynchophorus ferrugineus]